MDDLHLLVIAYGRDGDGLPNGLPPLLEGDHLAAALKQRFDDAAVVAQVLAQILHLLQQLLAFVQRELALAIRRVQQLVLPVTNTQENGCYIDGNEWIRLRLLGPFHPIDSNPILTVPIFSFQKLGCLIKRGGRNERTYMMHHCSHFCTSVKKLW